MRIEDIHEIALKIDKQAAIYNNLSRILRPDDPEIENIIHSMEELYKLYTEIPDRVQEAKMHSQRFNRDSFNTPFWHWYVGLNPASVKCDQCGWIDRNTPPPENGIYLISRLGRNQKAVYRQATGWIANDELVIFEEIDGWQPFPQPKEPDPTIVQEHILRTSGIAT